MEITDKEKLNNSIKEVEKQLGTIENLLGENGVIIDNFRELSQKIIEKEQQSPDASTEETMETFFEEIREKSAKRESQGMNRPAIELILKRLYKHTPPISFESQEFSMLSWPQTLDGSRSLLGKSPYKSRINPVEGSLSIYVHRKRDQKFKQLNFLKIQDIRELRQELEVEKLPEGFSEALYASDIDAHQYQLVSQAYRERQGSNASYQPLKVVEINYIENQKTIDVLSQYVKTDGETKTFSEEEEETFEAFNQILRTPLGRITPFMLVQNPEKLGYEETKDISYIDVKKDSWGNFTMMVYIAD